MRTGVALTAVATTCLLLPVLAQRPVPVPKYGWMKDILAGKEEYSAQEKQKRDVGQARLINPVIVMPPSGDAPSGPDDSQPSGGLTISDVITSDRVIGIFSGFTRDIESVSKRLEDGSQNSTILAPDNAHITKLPRKPWEDPKDAEEFGANAYAGSDGEDRAHRNLRRFTEAHVVPQSPWQEGDKVQTLAGSTVWFETKDGKKYVQPGNIEVDSVPNKVSNGEVWILKGVLNYQA